MPAIQVNEVVDDKRLIEKGGGAGTKKYDLIIAIFGMKK
jgi:hypothetical protein